MHPLVRVSPLALLGLLGAATREPARARASEAAPVAPEPLAAYCPEGTLPDGDACVAWPDGADEGGEDAPAAAGGHHDRRGRWQAYDQIPRQPERPADYARFAWPIATPDGPRVLSGYDLDLPDEAQRRGRRLSHVGHGGVDLTAPRGTEVHASPLEHQEGDAEVLFAGKLFGTTVVTRHTVRAAGRVHDYLVLFGHLDGVAPGVRAGDTARAGDLLGWVGDSASPGVVHLHLEVRRLRDGVDPRRVPPTQLVAPETSIVCDPRNVLPLAP